MFKVLDPPTAEILLDGVYAQSFTLDGTGNATVNAPNTAMTAGTHQLTALFAGNTSWHPALSLPLTIPVYPYIPPAK
jgi:hypothetical protein